jgi:hypothetical protein
MQGMRRREFLKIPHVKIAHEMGVGCGNLAQVDVVHLDA